LTARQETVEIAWRWLKNQDYDPEMIQDDDEVAACTWKTGWVTAGMTSMDSSPISPTLVAQSCASG
jgi:hypothetical protein